MKKILVILTTFLVLGLMWGWESTYTRQATLIREENNVSYYQDDSGNVWAYEGKVPCKSNVKLIMHDNHTSKITDDIIKKVK